MSWDITDRALEFSIRAVKLFRFLRKGRDEAGWIIGRQFMRAAASVGANIEEAQGAESRADFAHKYCIARKEARESLYWLKLLSKSGIIQEKKVEDLMNESQELIAILTSIIIKSRNKVKSTK